MSENEYKKVFIFYLEVDYESVFIFYLEVDYKSVFIFLSSWLLYCHIFSLQVSTEGGGGEHNGGKDQTSV